MKKIGGDPQACGPDQGTLATLNYGDGRLVSFAEFGAPDGFPLIALHGTPGSRLKFAGADSSARSLGLRLICPDRWGYGHSMPPPEPSLKRYGDDVAELADLLGLSRFGLIGLSGGAPFAATAASVLGNRIARLALVSPIGPVHETPTDGFRLSHRLCFFGLPAVPGATAAAFGLYRQLLLAAPRFAIWLASCGTVAVDRHLIRTPDVRDTLATSYSAGLVHGTIGPVIDLSLFSRDWQAQLGDVMAPTRIWLGTHDRTVPHAPVMRLAAEIPFAQLTLLHAQGHFCISRCHDDVLGWLAGTGRQLHPGWEPAVAATVDATILPHKSGRIRVR